MGIKFPVTLFFFCIPVPTRLGFLFVVHLEIELAFDTLAIDAELDIYEILLVAQAVDGIIGDDKFVARRKHLNLGGTVGGDLGYCGHLHRFAVQQHLYLVFSGCHQFAVEREGGIKRLVLLCEPVHLAQAYIVEEILLETVELE